MIKNLVNKISWIKLLLISLIAKNAKVRSIYLNHFYVPEQGTIAELIHKYSKKNGIQFLQIGGNDGKIGDPVHFFIKRDRWTGIILEPQRNVFEHELKKTYKNNKRIRLINAALDQQDGSRILYKISFSNKRWATGLSSFVKSKLEDNVNAGYVDECAKKHQDNPPKDRKYYIAEEKVDCISFASLKEQFNIQKLNFLIIDTEGYDFEIIKMFDFKQFKPEVILYEHAILSNKDKLSCEKYLIELGYKLFSEGGNTVAYMC